MSYGPDNWEENSPAAQQIYQKQDLHPQTILAGALLGGLNNDVCHIGQNLQGNDDHEDLFVFI